MVGPLPTPGIAFVASSMRSDAGVVISASHNAFHDNGIKKDGFKLSDDMEVRLETLMSGDTLAKSAPMARNGALIALMMRWEVWFLKTVYPQT